MKKLTFKAVLRILLLATTFGAQAQFSLGPGTYRIATVDLFEGVNLYAEPNGAEKIGLANLDETTNNQTFEFVNTGRTFNLTVDEETITVIVYNIVSVENGLHVQLSNLTSGSTRAKLREGTDESLGVLDDWFVQEAVDDESGETFFRIRTAHNDQHSSGERRLLRTNAADFVNSGGFSMSSDRWILQSVEVLNTNSLETKNFFVSNPVLDQLKIKGLTTNIENVEVYDIVGKKVLSTSLNAKSASLDISSLNRGLYIVKLSSSNLGTFSTKIVKQ